MSELPQGGIIRILLTAATLLATRICSKLRLYTRRSSLSHLCDVTRTTPSTRPFTTVGTRGTPSSTCMRFSVWLMLLLYWTGTANAVIADIDLASFSSGATGFLAYGAAENDYSGYSVSIVGDINDDSYGDVAIGAYGNDGAGSGSGAVYVLFGHGSTGTFPAVDLGAISSFSEPGPTTGFAIYGPSAGAQFGWSVSGLGDVNNDDIDDMALGLNMVTVGSNDAAGIVYVIFGKNSESAFSDIFLSGFTAGTAGFKIHVTGLGNYGGMTVAGAGDFNDDGMNDILIGAPNYSASGVNGAVFLILGRAGSGNNVDLSSMTSSSSNGIRYFGTSVSGLAVGNAGKAVSSAGDYNNDGFDDIIIGAPTTAYTDRDGCGAAFVIFGRAHATNAFVDVNLASFSTSASTGFRVFGAASGDSLGASVCALPDFNGDGMSDIAVGSPYAKGVGDVSTGGRVFVVYGRSSDVGDRDVLSYTANAYAFTVFGKASGDRLGTSVADAGDVNGDGFSDLVVAAPWANPGSYVQAGVVYVVFGKSANFADIGLNVFTTGASTGFKILGSPGGLTLGSALGGTGDVNGDGLSDLVLGGYPGSYGGKSGNGLSYVIFGYYHLPPTFQPTASPSTRAPTPATASPSRVPTRPPTPSPSALPTTGPSPGPSASPTAAPSAKPTVNPSPAPSASPTAKPSASPTVAPTLTPTVVPTPTASPTAGPSVAPTRLPTATPSVPPTPGPTTLPTANPSAKPTATPSAKPSVAPSAGPSVGPSAVPTTKPSASPTVAPTLSPTAVPTMPTASPTAGPSAVPTRLPTATPSVPPTPGPTTLPTENPSAKPTATPSSKPSVAPSAGPSAGPSAAPTPSASPTIVPTLPPTAVPTMPTASPTAGQSTAPSVAPSAKPTCEPSISPSPAPSAAPSAAPSVPMSAGPTATPTGLPTGAIVFAPVADIDLAMHITGGSERGFSIIGEAVGDYSGTSAGFAGDIDQDGAVDIFVGAPKSDAFVNNGGAAYIIYGNSSRPGSYANVDLALFLTFPSTGFQVYSPTVGGNAGTAVAYAGDVNGDGYPDMIYGAPGRSYAGRVRCGFAVVLYGSNSTTATGSVNINSITASQGFTVYGALTGDNIGQVVDGGGDFNGDGYTDVLVAAAGHSQGAFTNCGAAYLIFGAALQPVAAIDLASFTSSAANGLVIFGAEDDGGIGYSAKFVGDLNGDGLADIALGAPNIEIALIEAGVVYVVFGSNALALSTVYLTSTTTAGSRGFIIQGFAGLQSVGSALAGVGDINGDGVDDLLIGAPGFSSANLDSAGAAVVLFGGTAAQSNVNLAKLAYGTEGFALYGEEANDFAGISVSGAGDLNGDGIADIAIASRSSREQNGTIYVVFGRPAHDLWENVVLRDVRANSGLGFRILGAGGSNSLGVAMAGGGDINGDGVDDLLLGAPSLGALGRTDAGVTFVVFGTNSASNVSTIVDPAYIGGLQLAAVSADNALGRRVVGFHAGDAIGTAISAAGDLNEDEVPDFLVSSPDFDFFDRINCGAVHVLLDLNLTSTDDIDLAAASSVAFTIYGASMGDRLGQRVAHIGQFRQTSVPMVAIQSTFPGGISGVYILALPNAALKVDVDLSNFNPGTDGYFVLGSATDSAGMGLACAGDLNDDGYEDVLIGAPTATFDGRDSAGLVYVLFSSTENSDVALEYFVTSDTLGYRIIGPAGEGCGASVSAAGDVNGDGFQDVLVGCSMATVLAREGAGAVYIVYGSGGTIPVDDVDLDGLGTGIKVYGEFAQCHLGQSVSAAGDFNGDGLSDVILSCPGGYGSGPTSNGISYVVFGAAQSRVSLRVIDLAAFAPDAVGFKIFGTASAHLGRSVSGGRDVNGDGFADIVVGAPLTGNGAAFVLYGHSDAAPFPDIETQGFVSGSTGFAVLGESLNSRAGTVVGMVQDLNGDGIDEIFVSAPSGDARNRTDSGALYVVYGIAEFQQSKPPVSHPTPLPTALLSAFPTPAPSSEKSLDFDAGNFDSGIDGFLIGGSAANDALGSGVANLGDFNGDGASDLAMGCPQCEYLNRTKSGAVYILFGRKNGPAFAEIDAFNFSTGPAEGFVLWGASTNGRFGLVVSGPGDVNADGYTDLVVHAPADGVYGTVYIIFGGPSAGAADVDMSGFTTSAATGFRVTGAATAPAALSLQGSRGDFNSDGIPDMLFGCPLAEIGGLVSAGMAFLLLGRSYQSGILGDLDLGALTSGPSGLRVLGPAALRTFGRTLDFIGDINSDGLDDFAATTYYNTAVVGETGRDVFVIYGQLAGAPYTDIHLASFVSGALGFVVTTDPVLGVAGLSISGIGDVSGDQVDDFIVSYVRANSRGLVDNGVAYIIYGTNSLTRGDVHLDNITYPYGLPVHGAQANGFLGSTMCGVSDLNGDGYREVLVGARRGTPLGRDSAGIVYVLYGGPQLTSRAGVDLAEFVSGTDGFQMFGAQVSDNLGASCSDLGDFNGDGLTDFAVGGTGFDYNLRSSSGGVYVVLGAADRMPSAAPSAVPSGVPVVPAVIIDTADLSSTRSSGWKIVGEQDNDEIGKVATGGGDFNNDGYADILVTAPTASVFGRSSCGIAYLLYGSSGAEALRLVDLRNISADGSGFRIIGAATYDNLGTSAAFIGDVNDDGNDDIAVSAILTNNPSLSPSGVLYVLYGSHRTADLDLSADVWGTVGYRVFGVASYDQTGYSISASGDFNGDGLRDLFIGANLADPLGRPNAGKAYLLFGGNNSFSADIYLGNLSNDSSPAVLQILGGTDLDAAGSSLCTGDFNDDGIDDVAIGAPAWNVKSGAVYVIFGSLNATSRASIDLLNISPSDGFVIAGPVGSRRAGFSVANGGDVNGDGVADLIVGAVNSMQSALPGSGTAYIIYGTARGTVPAGIDLGTFTAGSRGYKIYRGIGLDGVAVSIGSVGDINYDGVGDFLVGAPGDTRLGRQMAGTAYIVFGHSDVSASYHADIDLNVTIPADTSALVVGAAAGDQCGIYVGPAGDINNDGAPDLTLSCPKASGFGRSAAGVIYVLLGISVRPTTSPTRQPTYTVTATPSAAPDLSLTNAFPADGELGSLIGGDNDFVAFGTSGTACGDMNGDGVDDYAIGALDFSLITRAGCGAVYVVFGVFGVPGFGELDTATFAPGVDGFRIIGPAADAAIGYAVTAVDIDGDGKKEIVTSSRLSLTVYVVFAQYNGATLRDVDLAVPGYGFVIIGSESQFGMSLANAGDFNADGVEDLLIGSPHEASGSGTVYVIFGKSNSLFEAELTGEQATESGAGLRIFGELVGSGLLGSSVSGAGDFNGDGYADILLGAPAISISAKTECGAAYVIFGQAQQSALGDIYVEELTSGVVLIGDDRSRAGTSVAMIGDMNGDGMSDIVIGAPTADPRARVDGGIAYVVYGRQPHGGFARTEFDAFSPTAYGGFQFHGISGAFLGGPVGSAGDMNGDGYDDVLISSPLQTGFAVYAIYGKNITASSPRLYDAQTFATGEDGVKIGGTFSSNPYLTFVTHVDANNDGADDILIATSAATYKTRVAAGAVHLVYGSVRVPSSAPTAPPTVQATNARTGDISMSDFIFGDDGFKMYGPANTARIGRTFANAGDFNGDGVEDLIVANARSSDFGVSLRGAAYVLYGSRSNPPDALRDLSDFVSGADGLRIYGSAANDRIGSVVGCAGDINDDGLSDVLIGSPTASPYGRTSAGALYVIFGSPYYDRDMFLNAPYHGFRITGGIANTAFGSSASPAGDMNNDGVADIIVGWPHSTNLGRADSGSAYVIYGQRNYTFSDIDLQSVTLSADAGFPIYGPQNASLFGIACSAAGDMNSDGYGDVVIGASNLDSQTGAAYLVYGAAQSEAVDAKGLAETQRGFEIYGAKLGSVTGRCVNLLGDVNGDGISDIAVSAPGTVGINGTVYVIYGRAPGRMSVNIELVDLDATVGFKIGTTGRTDAFGTAISAAGDINLDGIGDIAIGAFQESGGAGAAYIIFGEAGHSRQSVDVTAVPLSGEVGFRYTGEYVNDNFGILIATSDVNGDGVVDLVVGSGFSDPLGRDQAGTVYVLYGPVPALSPPTASPTSQPTSVAVVDTLSAFSSAEDGFRVLGFEESDFLGNVVIRAGDFNGDNVDDVAIAASLADVASSRINGGAVLVLYGSADRNFTDVAIDSFVTGELGVLIVGAQMGDNLGTAVAGGGDINSDGFDDLAIGANAASYSSRSRCGIVYVVFGGEYNADIDLRFTFTGYRIIGAAENSYLGTAVAFAGDVNGDGVIDILAGAQGTGNRDAYDLNGAAYVLYTSNVAMVDVDLATFAASATTGFSMYGQEEDAILGFALSSAGDLNNDSFADVAIGSPGAYANKGAVYVVFGGDSYIPDLFLDLGESDFSSYGFKVVGASGSSFLGGAVACVGDINGDNLPDLAIGAPVWNNQIPGSVHVIFGSTAPFSDFDLSEDSAGFYITAATTATSFGFSLSGGGDMNGDGINDLVIGAPLASSATTSASGAVYVIYGAVGLSDIDLANNLDRSRGRIFYGSSSLGYLGSSVDFAGDFNGDGVPDLILGASHMTVNGAQYAGTAYVLLHAPIPTLPPTASPSAVPTVLPTGPSTLPTESPTVVPSVMPSTAPTRMPTESPTPVPTLAPSSAPTTQPSAAPSAEPTTASPTNAPSTAPTALPSVDPSVVPTEAPTASPTNVPSIAPTPVPTADPSPSPTAVPTTSPTVVPTWSPTVSPSSVPTANPTTSPTEGPSADPTADPTIVPTAGPTSAPTAMPSAGPTAEPTTMPSAGPTGVPSAAPSAAPTVAPSTSPSAAPTVAPSTSPSGSPSAEPTEDPSMFPSASPSAPPTVAPTTIPTAKPTPAPVSTPTEAPNIVGTPTPSVDPTAAPTEEPSLSPSSDPTLSPSSSPPTVLPTVTPTCAPSPRPSAWPTQLPTAEPTIEPTVDPSATPSAVPSGDPTVSPTSAPSNPTAGPTISPSAPTADPTAIPTAPTIAPSKLPTAIPSVSPSARPSLAPTAVPTMGPTTEPSADPSAIPSGVPSCVPTLEPSAMPTAQPSADPTVAPSAPPTPVPSATPSVRPTSAPSAVPTLFITEPVKAAAPNVSTIDFTANRTSAVVRVTIIGTSEAAVYCGTKLSGSALGSTSEIVNQNSFAYTVNQAAELTLRSLSAATSYVLYCVTVSSDGLVLPLARAVATARPMQTACCKQVFVTVNTPTVFAAAQAPSAIVFAYDSPPSVSLNLALSFGPAQGAVAFPSLITIRNSSALSKPSAAVIGNVVGAQTLTVSLSGPSAAQFDVVYQTSRTVAVLSASAEPPLPTVSGARFSGDGSSAVITFSAPTNRGGYANSVACSALLSFAGISSATCQWTDASSLTIFPQSSIGAVIVGVGSNVTIKASLIRAACTSTAAVNCSTWRTIARTVVQISAPTIPTSPRVSITVPQVISSCNTLTVDLTNSAGSAGREWSTTTFLVSSAAFPAAADRLQLYLTRNFTLSPPTVVPSEVLQSGVTYAIKATLCNFLGACGSSLTSVSVRAADAVVPIVSILGPRQRTITRSSTLSLSSNAFTQSCTGAVSYANLELKWEISAGGALLPAAVGRSVSTNPANYRLNPFTLPVDVEYTIKLTARSMSSGLAASAQVAVYVQFSNLVAVITGGSFRSVRVGESVTIDGSRSYDEDVQSRFGVAAELTYQWTCAQASPVFSTVCDVTLAIASSTESVTLTPSFASANASYVIVLTVVDATRSSSAEVTVGVTSAVRPTVIVGSQLSSLTNINGDSNLVLRGSVELKAPCRAEWSVSDQSLQLSAITTTPTSASLIPDTRAVPFNLVVTGGSLPQRASLLFTLSCGGASNSLAVTTNGAPLPGLFTMDPAVGEELSTVFQYVALQWTDEDLPLLYQFGFQSVTSLANLVIVSKTELSFTRSTLPAGAKDRQDRLNCTLQVFDSLGAGTPMLFQSVRVTTVSAEVQQESLLSLVKSSTGSVDSTKNIISVVSSALNSVDCSAAPNCTQLNRSPCLKTSGECSGCLANYIGDIGDRSTLCIPVFARYERCSDGSDCLDWQQCDVATGTCVAPQKSCAHNCTENGKCLFINKISGAVQQNCMLSDTSCDAVCSCDGDYSGTACEIGLTKLKSRRELRSNLIDSLYNLTLLEDANDQTVPAWSASLYSVALNPFELSYNDAMKVLAVANSTVTSAKELRFQSTSAMLGVLQATDTVFSVSKYNYIPNDFNALNVTRVYDNNTADGIVQVVEAFATLLAQSMTVGENATTYYYDNFRVSSTLTPWAFSRNVSISSPQTEYERLTSSAVPSVLLAPAAGSSETASIATSMITVFPRAFATDTSAFRSSPVYMKVTSDVGEQPAEFVSSLEVTFPFTEADQSFVSYQPQNYTSICRNRRDVFTYTCADSGFVVTHNCTRGRGEYNTICPVPKPACANLNIQSAAISVLPSCRLVDYNASFVTCLCKVQQGDRRALTRRLQTGEESVIHETGVSSLVATGTYVALEFADTFNAAGELTDPAAVIIVIIMFATLWGAGILLLSVCFWRKFVSLEKKVRMLSRQVVAAVTSLEGGNSMEDARVRLMSYIENVIPSVFAGNKSSFERIVSELRSHHRYLTLFTLGDGQLSNLSKVLIIAQMLTMETMQMFLLAVLYDLQGPDDDHSCPLHTDEVDCLARKSIFDDEQSYCQWSLSAETGEMACSYRKQEFTMKIFIYLLILTSVFTAIINSPLDYFFKVVAAPSIEDAMEDQVANVAASGDSRSRRRFSAVSDGLRRISARTSQIAMDVRRRSSAIAVNAQNFVQKKFWYTDLVGGLGSEKVIADRDIPEDLQKMHKSAVAGLPSIVRHSQSLEQQRRSRSTRLKQRANSKRGRNSAALMEGTGNARGVVELAAPRHAAAVVARDADAPPANIMFANAGVSLRATMQRLTDEVICQRLLLPDNSPHIAPFEQQWGIVPSDKDDSYSICDEALAAIEEDVHSSDQDARELSEQLPRYTLHHGGLAILNMFLLDLLGRRTVAAKIFKNKFEEDFEQTQAVSQWFKALSIAILVGANAFFIYYSLLKALQKGKTWQYQYMQGCIAQMVVEIFLNETLECIWLNYFVPDLARKEVKRVTALLTKVVEDITSQADEVKNSLLFLDAPSYLFSSTKVAKTHPTLLESVVVMNFHSHLPGELSRTWPHYKRALLAQENKDEMLVDNDAGVVGGSGSRTTQNFLFRAILAVGAMAVLSLQWLGTLSFNVQRIVIRFVQPLILSGLTLLWIFASSGTIALFTTVACTAAFVWAFLWRQRYLYRNERDVACKVAPIEDDDCLDDDGHGELVALNSPANGNNNAVGNKSAQSSSRSDGSDSSKAKPKPKPKMSATLGLSERFRNLRAIVSSSSESDSDDSRTSSASSVGAAIPLVRSLRSVDTPSTISLTQFTRPPALQPEVSSATSSPVAAQKHPVQAEVVSQGLQATPPSLQPDWTAGGPQGQSAGPSFEFDLGDLYDDMDEDEEEELTGLPHPLGLTRTAPTEAAEAVAGRPTGVSAMTALSSAAPSPAAPGKQQYRGADVTDSLFEDLYDSSSDGGFSDFSDEDVVSAAVATRAAASTTAKESTARLRK